MAVEMKMKLCSKCGSPHIGQYDVIGEGNDQRWIKRHECVCAFWQTYYERMDNARSVRIDGQQYWIGSGLSKPRGMGGRTFWIELLDGSVIKTSDLRHCGTIPAEWSRDIWDNARFMTDLNIDEYMHSVGMSV